MNKVSVPAPAVCNRVQALAAANYLQEVSIVSIQVQQVPRCMQLLLLVVPAAGISGIPAQTKLLPDQLGELEQGVLVAGICDAVLSVLLHEQVEECVLAHAEKVATVLAEARLLQPLANPAVCHSS
jgi:hypothetical protein